MPSTLEQCRPRHAAVDLAKLAAAAAVVWIHVVDCEASRRYLVLCRFAVPFFTCAAVCFVLERAWRDRERPVFSYCGERLRRLYVPFLFWAAIYLAIRYAKHALIPGGSPIVLSPALLLNGTTHHLWFLPFICMVSVLTYACGRLLPRAEPRTWKWIALAFGAAGLAVALFVDPAPPEPEHAPISYFVHHALDTLPALFFGVAVLYAARAIEAESWLRRASLLVPLVFVIWDAVANGSTVAAHAAGASLLFAVLIQREHAWVNALSDWARLAFLIYLVHVAVIEVLQLIERRFGGGPHDLSADLSVWALAFVGSAIFARAIMSFRALRFAGA